MTPSIFSSQIQFISSKKKSKKSGKVLALPFSPGLLCALEATHETRDRISRRVLNQNRAEHEKSNKNFRSETNSEREDDKIRGNRIFGAAAAILKVGLIEKHLRSIGLPL